MQEELNAVYSLEYLLPDKWKTDPTTRKPSKKKRCFRGSYPDDATQIQMRNCEQNSPEWDAFRPGQMGGSELATLMGMDHFNNIVDKWQRDAGHVVITPSQDPNDYIPLDRGHWGEIELTNIFKVLFKAEVLDVGLFLHYRYPMLHISPDGIVKENPGFLHNKYLRALSGKSLLELKFTIHKNYSTKEGRNMVPLQYVPQLLLQMQTFMVSSIFFMCAWKTNEWSKPVPSPTTPDNPQGCDRYLIEDIRITKMFANDAAADAVIRQAVKYMAHLNVENIVHHYVEGSTYKVRIAESHQQMWVWRQHNDEDESKEKLAPGRDFNVNNSGELSVLHHPGIGAWDSSHSIIVQYPPKLITTPLDLPDIVILPLYHLQVCVYMDIDSKTGQYEHPCVDGDRFLHGTPRWQINQFFDQKPLQVSMKALEAQSDEAIELDSIPQYESKPLVLNPLLRKLQKEYPHLAMRDVVWQFVTKGDLLQSENELESLRLFHSI